jgi:hypothetical protein
MRATGRPSHRRAFATSSPAVYGRVRQVVRLALVAGAVLGLLGVLRDQESARAAAVALFAFALLLHLWSPTLRVEPPAELMPATHFVTLVHGTWGRGSAWTRDGSELRHRIAQTFVEPVEFAVFAWTGRNTTGARYGAAEELRSFLQTLSARFPEATHHIVAHSHGGNVSLYALRDDELRGRVAGVACLATPFIHSQPRELGGYGAMSLALFVASPLLLAAHALVWVLAGKITSDALAALLLLPLYVATAWVSIAVGMVLSEDWSRLAYRQAQRAAVRPADVPVLIIRTTGDEASAAIGASHLIASILNHLWTFVGALSGLAATVLINTFRFLWLRAGPAGKVSAFALAPILLALTSLVSLPVSALVLLGMIVGGAALYVAGPGHGFVSPLIEVTTEATPAGVWTVNHFDARDDWVTSDGLTPRISLAHSASYNNSRAIDRVCEWLKDTAARERRTGTATLLRDR